MYIRTPKELGRDPTTSLDPHLSNGYRKLYAENGKKQMTGIGSYVREIRQGPDGQLYE